MLDEIVSIFAEVPGGVIIDATFGFGGHTKALAERAGGKFKYMGFDRDGEILNRFDRSQIEGITLHNLNYSEIPSLLIAEKITPVNGVLFDLGLNSAHLDDPSRGFSFQSDAPLDMRFDRSSGISASAAIGDLSESEMIDILRNYGQERKARAIARRIIARRPATTGELADIVREVSGGRDFNKSAARVFQAFRIYVNDELYSLEKALKGIIPLLSEGGRIAVISYHSLEDGLVKRIFQLNSGKCFCGPEKATCVCGANKSLTIKSKKPVLPSPEETKSNPRARSARLRYAEKKKLQA